MRAFERVVHGAVARGIVRSVGDDAAVLRPTAGYDLLLTADSLVEGRHFRRDWFKGRELGRRVASVNLSDVAAMGGDPQWALLSLAVPDGADPRYIVDIERGARDQLARFGGAIVGGNVSGIGRTLVCDMTLAGLVRRGRHWRRTCRPGDAIVVVGRLGEARAGLEILQSGPKHRSSAALVRAYKDPVPLVAVARLLRGGRAVHGAIDVSDGFTLDLVRMCEDAGAGCVVESQQLKPSRPLATFCRTAGRDPLDYMMNGGDDYALILSISRRQAPRLENAIRRLRLPVATVGHFTRERGAYLLERKGERRSFEPRGWDHLRPHKRR